MNIAIFASAFHPHVGGVEELCRQLAGELLRSGHRPMVFTNRWPKTLPESEEIERVPVRRYVFRVPERTWRQMGGWMLYGGATLRQVCGELRRHRTEVIHVQCLSSNAYYAVKAKRKLGLPLVVTLQGELTMDASGLYQRSLKARQWYRWTLDQADMITACSAQTLEEAEEFYGRPFGKRGRVIYNGIRLADFDNVTPHLHPRPYILAIGRHVAQKGFDTLIRAMKLACESGMKSHDLIIAGDGVERASLERLAGKLGLGARVRFIGRVTHDQAVRLFAGCDMFVLPSRHEPFGIVCLEAMAAGKPVIATRVGGVPEFVTDGGNGLLVVADSPGEMSIAMSRLISDSALRGQLAARGLRDARSFDWNSISAQYANTYHAVLNAKPMIAVDR